MKILRIQPVALALAASLLLAHPAAAKTKKNFLPFEGTYSGVATILFPGGSTGTTPVSVTVSVPENGRSATMRVSGTTISDGETVPLSSALHFSGGVFTIANEFFAESSFVPAPGSYAITSPRAFRFSSVTPVDGSTISLEGTVTVRPMGKKRQSLNMSAVLTTSLDFRATVQLALTSKPAHKHHG